MFAPPAAPSAVRRADALQPVEARGARSIRATRGPCDPAPADLGTRLGMSSNYQLLEKAERLELLAQLIYEALADRFGGATRETFKRLASEESQHASRIRLLAARYGQDRSLVASLAVDTPLIDRLLVEAAEALAAVKSGSWDGDPQAALAGAAALENRFCQAHAQSLSKDAHPELRAFFEQLAAQDKAHAALLKG